MSSARQIVTRVQILHVYLLHAWMFGTCLSKLCQQGLGLQEYEVSSPAVDLPSSIFAPKKEEFRGEILHYSYVHGYSSERASPLKSTSTSGSTAEPAAGTLPCPPPLFDNRDSNSVCRQSFSQPQGTSIVLPIPCIMLCIERGKRGRVWESSIPQRASNARVAVAMTSV